MLLSGFCLKTRVCRIVQIQVLHLVESDYQVKLLAWGLTQQLLGELRRKVVYALMIAHPFYRYMCVTEALGHLAFPDKGIGVYLVATPLTLFRNSQEITFQATVGKIPEQGKR